MRSVIFVLIGGALLSLLSVVGDFFLKLAGNGKKFMEPRYFLVGLAIYIIGAFGWFYFMKNAKLVTLNTIFTSIVILGITGMGAFYFKEPLNIYEIIGVFLAITSVILMTRFA